MKPVVSLGLESTIPKVFYFLSELAAAGVALPFFDPLEESDFDSFESFDPDSLVEDEPEPPDSGFFPAVLLAFLFLA
jgi:hypothetical protein